MKRDSIFQKILPHVFCVILLVLIHIAFFHPIFFNNKTLYQHDIRQFVGSSQSLVDYKEKTGDEGLWAENMFSGMPAYLIRVQWDNYPFYIVYKIISFNVQHPIVKITLGLIGYYFMLIIFGVRPWIALAGSLAFVFSSYMIIGLGAGHNSRIGAISLIPFVVAGVHLAYSSKEKRLLGMAITALFLSMHLQQSHLQITYYLMLILIGYGIVQFFITYKEKQLRIFFITSIGLVIAALLSVLSLFGSLWSVQEYQKYSIRGPSEIKEGHAGLSKSYSFEYSNDIWEPLTLLLPNVYGGASSSYLVQQKDSKTYQALSAINVETANQLARYTRSYWGSQPVTTPYYGGAIIFFLFIAGLLLVKKEYLYWLIPLSVLSIMISWGDHFSTLNYFLFDYLPGFNKFRSVTFILIIILFAMPLLSMLVIEEILQKGIDQSVRKKLLWALGITGGICVIAYIGSGFFDLYRKEEQSLPSWLLQAMKTDRANLLSKDALRSLFFIIAMFSLLYFNLYRRVPPWVFYIAFAILIIIDTMGVSRRYFGINNYTFRHGNITFNPTRADEKILKDTTNYRVLNLNSTFNEARTSYFHQSVGGYHGAKLRRYQDMYDSLLSHEMNQLIVDARGQGIQFSNYDVINMLNVKYVTYGPDSAQVIRNPQPNGNAWFIQKIQSVPSPKEELHQLSKINTRTTAVMDTSHFTIPDHSYDSLSEIKLIRATPRIREYVSQSSSNGLAVFSEIYYPHGWTATIDEIEVPILRANYILRALKVPAGKHTIKFSFNPKAYYIGNRITEIFSWVIIVFFVLSVGHFFYKKN